MGIYSKADRSAGQQKVGYAVVGLGHIAQVAVLPAFKHAENSELSALVSDDEVKLRELGEQYGVERLYTYDQYQACLEDGRVDAVYIALPNSMHRAYTERAARAGVHVLCEKPMAVTEEDCKAMMAAAEEGGVKLMIAYRLHFEESNLKAIDIARCGELGDVRMFSSVFTMQVKEGNIRLKNDLGGGALYDIGIYCINAARNLFHAEPIEVFATHASNGEPRFSEVPEMTTAILRFPEERLAVFTCSFGAADVSSYRIVGTKGDLVVEPAYEYQGELAHRLTVDGKTKEQTFKKRDQFAPELIAFSQSILMGKDIEPSGMEGLLDVRVIRALLRSAEVGRPVTLEPFDKAHRPSLAQEIQRPPVKKPPHIHAESPSGD